MLSIKELANEIIRISGKDLKPIHVKPREGDIRHSYADIKKARKLGFKPKVDLRKGLRELIQS